MASNSYKFNEAFYSLQGEGRRSGTANVFLRFSGCNLQCSIEEGPKSPGGFDCDTEFASGRRMNADDAISWCHEMREDRPSSDDMWVIFTGGEPGIQLDKYLVDAFHSDGWKCAIETNGSVDVSGLGLDWITVSPKVAEHAIRQMTADEVKYVRGYGQALPKPKCKAPNKLLSPAFNGLSIDRKALEWCISLIKDDPSWQMSVQYHKAWSIA